MRRSAQMTGLIVLLLLVLSLTTFGQQPVGSIEGSVTDQNGALISGARVTIKEKTTGRVINIATNNDGFFVARALLPGQYNVRIEQQGFSPAVLGDVTVLVGQVANASVAIRVGGAMCTVEVAATTVAQVDISGQRLKRGRCKCERGSVP